MNDTPSYSNDTEFPELLLDYIARAHLWHQLVTNHSDEELNDLMLKMVETEQALMTYYGLPFTLKYSELFQFFALKEDFVLADIAEFILSLEEAANEYILQPVLTDVQLLQQAKENSLKAEDVLPELSLHLQPQHYYLFLYDVLFLQEDIDAAAILQEMQLVSENQIAGRLHLIGIDNMLLAEEDNNDIWEMGLQFLGDFMGGYPRYAEENLCNKSANPFDPDYDDDDDDDKPDPFDPDYNDIKPDPFI
ncbi:hypothetical protein [Arcticibacter svalbardensis]|nr:hypothetical protein [Arcticibacter svalbardensis]